jgi:superfamily II DNA or RNA helicase
VLILAHRGELLDQAADKMRRSVGLECSIEKADETSLGKWERITIGSVQSMMRPKRLSKFRPDHFAAIIVDEAHHALADSYQRVLDHFSEANVLGVTATPDRGDKRSLGQIFDSMAYEYSLPQAVKDGFLCPITAATAPLKIDLTSVKIQAGDYQLSGVATALDPYLEQIADELVKHRERKTVVFLPLIATGQKFAHLLRLRGLHAVEVNGESASRAETLAKFDAAENGVLCNAMLLTEGWDCPSVDCIVVLRPTRIRSLYCQMVGRGTRIHPGKKDLLILDFLWHTANHELVHPSGLVAESPEVAEKMTEILAESPGEPADLESLEQQANDDVLIEREEALAKRLESLRKKKGKLVDPLQYEISIGAEDLADYQPAFGWEMEPVSEEQFGSLEKSGVFAGDIDNAGKASLLLDRLAKRKDAGLASPKQIRLLERKGFQHVGQWAASAANGMISRIAASGWRTPASVDPKTFKPPPTLVGEYATPWYLNDENTWSEDHQ